MINLIRTLHHDKISVYTLSRKAKEHRFYGWQRFEDLKYDRELIRQFSAIVEAVLLGLPTPHIGGFQQNDGEIEFITSTRIITALIGFMENRFALIDMRVAHDYEGKRYSEIEPILQNRLDDHEISYYYILESKVDDDTKSMFVDMMEQVI